MKVHSFRPAAGRHFRRNSTVSPRSIARSLAAFALLLPLIILLPATADAQATCRGLVVTINMNTNGGNGTGTDLNDVILGTSGPDMIRGGAGVDTICAGGGNDTIYGDGGSDRIRGEGGHDKIYAGSGADDVWGGPGNDTIYGHGGQDDIWGEDGDDIIQGNHQSDKLYGGNGDDVVAGAGGKDLIYGDAGDDILRGGNNSDQLFGGPGIDNLNGQSGSDTLTGGPGNDTCVNGTQIDCAEPLPDTTAPYWTNPSISIEGLSRWDFVVTWGTVDDATALFEVDITDDSGVYVKEVAQPHWQQVAVDTFVLPFAGGETYNVEVSAVDAAGNRSPRLSTTVTIPEIGPVPGTIAAGDEPFSTGPNSLNATAAGVERCWSKSTPQEAEYQASFLSHRIGSHNATSRVCYLDGAITSNSETQQHDCEKHGPFALALRTDVGADFDNAPATEVTNRYTCTIIRGATVNGVGLETRYTMTIEHRFYFKNGELWVHWERRNTGH